MLVTSVIRQWCKKKKNQGWIQFLLFGFLPFSCVRVQPSASRCTPILLPKVCQQWSFYKWGSSLDDVVTERTKCDVLPADLIGLHLTEMIWRYSGFRVVRLFSFRHHRSEQSKKVRGEGRARSHRGVWTRFSNGNLITNTADCVVTMPFKGLMGPYRF